jgi:hypothetical protein
MCIPISLLTKVAETPKRANGCGGSSHLSLFLRSDENCLNQEHKSLKRRSCKKPERIQQNGKNERNKDCCKRICMVGVQKKRRRRRRRRRMDAAALDHLLQWLSAYMVVGLEERKRKTLCKRKIQKKRR